MAGVMKINSPGTSIKKKAIRPAGVVPSNPAGGGTVVPGNPPGGGNVVPSNPGGGGGISGTGGLKSIGGLNPPTSRPNPLGVTPMGMGASGTNMFKSPSPFGSQMDKGMGDGGMDMPKDNPMGNSPMGNSPMGNIPGKGIQPGSGQSNQVFGGGGFTNGITPPGGGSFGNKGMDMGGGGMASSNGGFSPGNPGGGGGSFNPGNPGGGGVVGNQMRRRPGQGAIRDIFSR